MLELLIAVAVTSLSVLGIASLQGSALQVNRQTGQTQEATHLVRSELAAQRGYAHGNLSARTGQACSVVTSNCRVDSYPCTFSANTLRCAQGPVAASELVGHQIVVTVRTADTAPFSLYAVVRR